jgi:hypothetical protein
MAKRNVDSLSEPFRSEFVALEKRLRFEVCRGKELDEAVDDLYSLFYNTQAAHGTLADIYGEGKEVFYGELISALPRRRLKFKSSLLIYPILFFLGICYTFYFQYDLYPLETSNYTILYSCIFAFAVQPVLYFSAPAFLIGLLCLQNPLLIKPAYRAVLLGFSLAALSLYFLLALMHILGVQNFASAFASGLLMYISAHPYVFAILAAAFALGVHGAPPYRRK